MLRQFIFILVFLSGTHTGISAHAQESRKCAPEDRSCIIDMLETVTADIDNQRWRDQTYREIAKIYAFDGNLDKALAVLNKIETPDTVAMSIRGIGMTLADQTLDQTAYTESFSKLRSYAETIEHPPSYAIALTYIAMAQAFAGDNEGAWATAKSMKNDALRHKAYAETAEIQAEKGNYEAARQSIEAIESLAFRNKAFSIVAKILTEKEMYDEAMQAAYKIDNPYKKAQALKLILDTQKPRDAGP